MKIRHLFLFPFALLYGAIVTIRNFFFNKGIFKQTQFDLPVICVGNLSVGGSGKTPTVEYLIRMLSPNYKIAVLSRGYKRKTKGFYLATNSETVENIGDEPLQYKTKFPEIIVTVDEKRVRGIKMLKKQNPDLQIVILDDAYQHRWVKPSINILLTEYYKPYYKDYLLPMGRLREPRSQATRADIIVVTKSPKVFSPIDCRLIQTRIKPTSNQELLFSFIEYGEFVPLFDTIFPYPFTEQHINTILMVAGIANPDPFHYHLKQHSFVVENCLFPDHHPFSSADIVQIIKKYNSLPTKKKMIVTTEKDAMRLRNREDIHELQKLPIYYVPIQYHFYKHDEEILEKAVLGRVENIVKNTRL